MAQIQKERTKREADEIGWLVTTTSQWQLNATSAPAASTAHIFDVMSVQ